MINFDDIKRENIKEHICPQILCRPYRMLII